MSLRTLLAASVILLCGCGVSPEDHVVGIWSAVPDESTIPPIPIAELQRDVNRYVNRLSLKLRSDHSFVLPSVPPVEGKWSLQGNRITLMPKGGEFKGPMKGLVKEMVAELNAPKTRLVIRQPSPLGDVVMVLRKTG